MNRIKRVVLTTEERAARMELIVSGRRKGWTWPQIAACLGISKDGLLNWLDKAITMHHVARTERKCLRCSDAFLSEGAHHRLCQTCRFNAPASDSPYTPDPGGSCGRQVRAAR